MSSEKELDKIRKKIDQVDRKLIELISERASLASEIAKIKKQDGTDTSFYRPEREARVIKQAISENKGPLSNEEIARLFRELMSACLRLEQVMKIGYLGPQGTFTQTAALKHFGHSIEAVELSSIDQVFHEVMSGACHFGVVPIENSIEGVVNHTLDMLINSNLTICGEVELKIHQYLLSKSIDVGSVDTIFSHQHSFAQCRRWLDNHMPKAECITVASNAEAARLASGKDKSAAIAGESAAELYDLTILAKNIEDESDNTTRFLVIGNIDVPPSGHDKSSLLFSMPSKPGSLLKMLSCFAENSVNLTRIESRPSRQGMWEYVFFVDVDGHIEDPAVAAAIKSLESEASVIKIFGSYPKAVL